MKIYVPDFKKMLEIDFGLPSNLNIDGHVANHLSHIIEIDWWEGKTVVSFLGTRLWNHKKNKRQNIPRTFKICVKIQSMDFSIKKKYQHFDFCGFATKQSISRIIKISQKRFLYPLGSTYLRKEKFLTLKKRKLL